MMLVITSDREASPIRMRQMDDRIRLPPALVLGLPAWGDEGNPPHDGVHIFEPLARGGCDADRRRAPMDDSSALSMSDEPPRCR
jgi:hypothetical protein